MSTFGNDCNWVGKIEESEKTYAEEIEWKN